MAATTVLYNTVDLNTASIITSDVTDAQTPDHTVTLFNLARANGGVVTNNLYAIKTIKIQGTLVAASLTAIEALIDTFHAIFAGTQDKNLDLGYNGSTRRYVCTPTVVTVSRPVRAASWAKFDIELVSTEFGKDTSTTTLVSGATHTTSSNTQALTIGGSAYSQKLRVQITVTAATGLTTKAITIQNGTSLESLTVTRTWVVGDVLEVDAVANTVKVNGTVTDYTGLIFTFAPGTPNLVTTNTFTTRTLTLTVDYVKRYQ